MNALTRKLAALAIAAATAMAPTWSQADRTAKVLPDFTVFLDPPTGFVFVKLPRGWKFVGKVDAVDAARLPQGVVTALLEGNEDIDARAVTTAGQSQ